MSPESYFSLTYFEARSRFKELAKSMGGSLESLEIKAKGPNQEHLTIELASFGEVSRPKLFIISSGIHGVEGFAGSAVQLAVLSKLPAIPSDVRLVFVHTLNPFGMAWKRRVNENNVDLNRNFIAIGESYSGSDKKYQSIDPFLNPKVELGLFWPHLLLNLARFGFGALKNAVVGGQYDFPGGLFFGGKELEEGPALYKSWLRKNSGNPKSVMVLDIHTGLGKFGEEVLFCHNNGIVPDLGKPVTALSHKVGYKVRGGLETLTAEIFPKSKWVHFTEEFGTASMAEILRYLREENFDFQRTKTTGVPQEALYLTLSPYDEKWKATVVEKGLETFNRSMKWIGKN